MRMSKRGEKGFTLIELLIVVAILGVLAAVVIPNVGRFIGAGEEESAETEFANVQTAVIAMMVDNQLSELPNPVTVATNWMGDDPDTAGLQGFPDLSVCAAVGGKITDPDGELYVDGADPAGDKDGYLLYGHDITGGDDQTTLVNYLATDTTKGTYTVDASGTITRVTTGYE